VTPKELINSQMPIQIAYVHRDGKVKYGQPRNYLVSFSGGPLVAGPNNKPNQGAKNIDPPPPAPKAPGSVSFPGKVANGAVGGAGRFLILHAPSQKQLIIFDLKEGKIAKTLDMPEEKLLFTAGRQHLLIWLPNAKTFERWNLATLEREAEIPDPLGREV